MRTSNLYMVVPPGGEGAREHDVLGVCRDAGFWIPRDRLDWASRDVRLRAAACTVSLGVWVHTDNPSQMPIFPFDVDVRVDKPHHAAQWVYVPAKTCFDTALREQAKPQVLRAMGLQEVGA